ncbi:MAG: FliM/FliN family flagellar motor switch protein [Candidatus Eremiobacteraeota bacterium]|nr:FliM/FliN family flagellar motor switch protein [Candidatus Eremiobacteraeota bacterium]
MMSAPILTLGALTDIEVSVNVVVGKARCRISEVLTFAEGVVVPLAASAQAPVELFVNGVAVASGEIVELEDGTLALEILSVRADARAESQNA